MTARERMFSLFRGVNPPEPVVCLHTWGRYPFESQGLEQLYGSTGGEALAEVYEGFLSRFPNDWLHVREELAPREVWGTPSPCDEYDEVRPPAAAHVPRSIEDVDELYRSLPHTTAPEVRRLGWYDHVGVLARRLGGRIMIAPNQGAPGSGYPGLSFEDQLILIHERPDLVQRAVWLDDERFLGRARAAREEGADAYILSEGYGGAVDLISPELFRRVFLEPKREFYAQLRGMGLYGIGYFLGDVRRYLGTIADMGVDAVMIEESKKGFVLDPVQIRAALPERIVLFGNLDSILLLRGTAAEIRAEVRRQARALERGPFALVNGSPICPGTPAENLHAFLDEARSIKLGPGIPG